MTPAEAQSLARRLRRDYWLAGIVRIALLTLIAAWVAVSLVRPPLAANAQDFVWLVGLAAFTAWILLTMLGVRQVQAANRASVMIAAGRLDLAEEHLVQTLRQFGIYRASKLLACHCLAVVVHGQKQYREAAELCGAVVAIAPTRRRPVSRLCRILLADCALGLGDLDKAVKALAPLRLRPLTAKRRNPEDLSLAEQMLLLPIELRCLITSGRVERAVEDLSWRIRVAELLESPKAALVHGLLSEACRRLGRFSQASFLQRRAELYHDLADLPDLTAIGRNNPTRTLFASPDNS